MIKTVMVHDQGVIVAIGIVRRNIELMEEGKPMVIRLGELVRDAGKGPPIAVSRHAVGDENAEMTGELDLMVYYGETHVAIVDRWNEELTSSGLFLPDRAMEDAAKLDEQLRSEGLI